MVRFKRDRVSAKIRLKLTEIPMAFEARSGPKMRINTHSCIPVAFDGQTGEGYFRMGKYGFR
jgi:hypothetical protein